MGDILYRNEEVCFPNIYERGRIRYYIYIERDKERRMSQLKKPFNASRNKSQRQTSREMTPSNNPGSWCVCTCFTLTPRLFADTKLWRTMRATLSLTCEKDYKTEKAEFNSLLFCQFSTTTIRVYYQRAREWKTFIYIYVNFRLSNVFIQHEKKKTNSKILIRNIIHHLKKLYRIELKIQVLKMIELISKILN